jgi:hypothetical protein
MNNLPLAQVVEVEQVKDGVLIGFEDGKYALYSTLFLYSACDLMAIMEEVDLPTGGDKTSTE